MCLNNPFKGIVYLFKFTCTQRKLKAEQNHPFQEFDIVVLLFCFTEMAGVLVRNIRLLRTIIYFGKYYFSFNAYL